MLKTLCRTLIYNNILQLLEMGKIINLFLFVMLSTFVNAQIKIIEVHKEDMVKMKKYERNTFLLTIYYSNNIEYNKRKNYKPIEYAGGFQYCEKCKKEYNFYFVEKSVKPKGKLKVYRLQDAIVVDKNATEYFDYNSFWNQYIKINGLYYKIIALGPIP